MDEPERGQIAAEARRTPNRCVGASGKTPRLDLIRDLSQSSTFGNSEGSVHGAPTLHGERTKLLTQVGHDTRFPGSIIYCTRNQERGFTVITSGGSQSSRSASYRTSTTSPIIRVLTNSGQYRHCQSRLGLQVSLLSSYVTWQSTYKDIMIAFSDPLVVTGRGDGDRGAIRVIEEMADECKRQTMRRAKGAYLPKTFLRFSGLNWRCSSFKYPSL